MNTARISGRFQYIANGAMQAMIKYMWAKQGVGFYYGVSTRGRNYMSLLHEKYIESLSAEQGLQYNNM